MTAEEIRNRKALYDNKRKLQALKIKLKSTDYKAIKYAEGWLTEEEYAPIKAEREAIREQIRALEADNAAASEKKREEAPFDSSDA